MILESHTSTIERLWEKRSDPEIRKIIKDAIFWERADRIEMKRWA